LNREAAMGVLDAVYRAESRNLFARLVRSLGDFDAAEDGLQDAVRAAADLWPKQGIPDRPAGWLFQTARFRGIDILRRKSRLAPLADYQAEPLEEPHEVRDELLRLIFTCCHPAISPDAQIALTLREVCELTTEEIAHAFFTPPPTIAQRIVRAKAKIREAAIPFEVPTREELPNRLNSVLKTVYLVFNEGYSSSSGQSVVRTDLVGVAIHLCRQIVEILPEPEAMSLLALMLVHQARIHTRTTPDGDIILLEDQDRSLWDRDLIRQADELVTVAFRSGAYGPYTVHAAIALLHASARSSAETRWDEIVSLYDLLFSLEPSPIVQLNRAVAVAMRDGPAAGIDLISGLLAGGALKDYHLTYAARGELYRRLGDAARARADRENALKFARQEPERRLIEKRLAQLS
jgi:RNA polymerase sigma-70 factor (ECF subfamily)